MLRNSHNLCILASLDNTLDSVCDNVLYSVPETDPQIIYNIERILNSQYSKNLFCKETRISDRCISFDELTDTSLIHNNLLPSKLPNKLPQWNPKESVPTWEESAYCYDCHQQFGLLNWRHHCRGCGKSICGDCYTETIYPQYGYLTPVKICNNCHLNKNQLDIESWLNIDSIEGIDIAYYLSKGTICDILLDKGSRVYQNNSYELALKCFILGKLPFDKWIEYINNLIDLGEMIWARNYISILKKQIFNETKYANLFNKFDHEIILNLSALNEDINLSNQSSNNNQIEYIDSPNNKYSEVILNTYTKFSNQKANTIKCSYLLLNRIFNKLKENKVLIRLAFNNKPIPVDKPPPTVSSYINIPHPIDRPPPIKYIKSIKSIKLFFNKIC